VSDAYWTEILIFTAKVIYCCCFKFKVFAVLDVSESGLQKKQDHVLSRNLEERVMGLLGAMIPEIHQVSIAKWFYLFYTD